VEAQLMAITPKRFRAGAHHWLILHGRYVCVARTPKCPLCPIRIICRYPAKTGSAQSAAKRLDEKRSRPRRLGQE
jgi:endonuclease-3